MIIALVTLAVFLPLAGGEFSWWDDLLTVHQNPWLKAPPASALAHYWRNPEHGLYIPVTYSAWIGLAQIARLDQPDEFGITLNPWVFHSANLLVHVTAALLTYGLLRRLVRHEFSACLGALLFALHPVQVESVGWISGLKDLLAGCLGLLALLQYIRRAEKPAKFDWLPDPLGTIALVAAMLAKPSAAMVPVIALCIDRWILARPWPVALRAVSSWAVLMIPVLVIARMAQTVQGYPHAPLWARLLIASDTFAFYLHKLIFPLSLGMDYGRRPQWVMQQWWFYLVWIVPLIVLGMLWLARRRWLTAAVLVFVVAYAPVSGLATFQFQYISTTADHYLYLAMLGPAIALAFACREFDRRIVRHAIVAVLALLAIRTVIQTRVWRDDLALFTNALRVNPNSFLAHNNLGATLQVRGEIERALEHYRISTQINSEYSYAYDNIAVVLAGRGDLRGAVEAMEKSLDIRSRYPWRFPGYVDDHLRVGRMHMELGDTARAIAHFEALLAEKPHHAEAREALEIARQKLETSTATQPASAPATSVHAR